MQCKKMQKNANKCKKMQKNASSYTLQNKRNGGPRKIFMTQKVLKWVHIGTLYPKKCVADQDLIKIWRKNQFLKGNFNFCIFQTF